MRDSVSGKVALITGASAGIGAAAARELGRRGARLVLVARRLDRLEALSAELRSAGVSAIAVAADVTQDGDLEAAVTKARAELGPIDIAIANAGFGVIGSMVKLELSDIRRQIETNLFGVLRTFIATRDDLIAGRGRLAVVGSVQGYFTMPGSAPYTMSKFAVRAFCDTVRYELRPLGVSVTHIIPGFVETEIRHLDSRGAFDPERPDPAPRWLVMPAAEAALEIADALERRQAQRVITRHGQLAMVISRHAPWIFDVLFRKVGTKFAKRSNRPREPK